MFRLLFFFLSNDIEAKLPSTLDPGAGGGGGGALAGQPRIDVWTKDRKTYPKRCVRHFEIDTPFHFVQSKINPFQCSKLKRILSYSATFCKLCKTYTFSYKNSIFPTLNDDSAAHCPARKKYPFSSFFFCSHIGTQLTSKRPHRDPWKILKICRKSMSNKL